MTPLAFAQTFFVPTPRITQPIDESQLVPLVGNIHYLATAKNDRGPVPDNTPVGHIIMLLSRSQEQEQALEALIDNQQNRRSPYYQQWLTSEQFGKQFGPVDSDMQKVTGWLQSKGFTIEDVPPGRTYVIFTGTVGQIREAFHTEIHTIDTHGETHHANMSDPLVPAALAPVIRGFRQLTDFRAKPLMIKAGAVKHNPVTGGYDRVTGTGLGSDGLDPAITFGCYSSGVCSTETFYDVGPQDWYTIYDVNPILQSGINGAGVTIAVIEETEVVNQSDITIFRSQFGLPTYPGTPNATNGGVNWIYGPGHGCTAPPKPTSTDEEAEALLDAEWAGTAAPNAIVDFVACDTTAETIGSYGTDIAAGYIINYLGSTVSSTSLSYGECEASAGSSGTAFYATTWQQGAAEGITHVVSTGDAGSVQCDQNDAYATHNLSVNAMSSSAYNIAAGGTDFGDTYTSFNYSTSPASTWWSSNDTSPYGSALSYLPEISWGGYCSSSLFASYLQKSGSTVFGSTYTPVAICNNSTAGADGYRAVVGGAGGISAYNAIPTWQSVYGIGSTGDSNNTSTSHRNQPDVSFFAANGFWGHALLYCQSDAGYACTYNNSEDAYYLQAGGTSFVAPQINGLMALVVQKTGTRQGVANYTLYGLAAQEYGTTNSPDTSTLATCSGSGQGAAVGSNCIFRDISNDTASLQGGTIASDNAQPCRWSSVTTCWRDTSSRTYGITSVGSHPTTENDAYLSSPGYDLTTGLGSVDISNLVNGWNTLSPGFATTTTNSASSNSITPSGSTTLTATVTETGRGGVVPPAGTVSFYIGSTGGTNLGSAPLTASASPTNQATGSLVVQASALQPGANQIIAHFPGDGANDAASTSVAVTVTVNGTPGIYSPVNGSTLASNAATFSWYAYPGATAYYLDLGASQGSNTYLDSGSLSSTTLSYSVTSLPVNGSTVWARWYYYINGGWQYTDYSYTAYGGIPSGDSVATITSPAPSSTLTGSSVTFSWSAGVGPSAYWLDVGNVAGGNQYYSSGNLGTTTSATVSGLPTNGSTVYATLYSLIGSIWFSNAYTYTAFSPGAMQTPTPGSTLAGSSVTFTWSAAAGATAYWLDIGTSPGGNTIYTSGNLGNALTTTVNGLPTNGSTVYVTLYSLVGGQWLSNAYTYTAFNLATGLGVMQTPTPGSALTGSSVMFTWSAGPDATGYWVDIGTSPGGNTIYTSGNLGNVLTTTVNGLPTNGSTVYVTLYSLVGGQWFSNSYTYTALNLATALGVMHTPTPGSTLSGNVATFTWSASSVAIAYWLDIGNVPGGNQYYQSGNLGNLLTTTVYSLPADGSTIYVTLYSYVGGQWFSNSYTYLSGP